MTLNQISEWEEIERPIAYLQERSIDIGNTEILFNQFIYLKDYLKKNNANRNCEATMKLSTEEKWLKFFIDTQYIDQKSCLIKLCEYVFAIQAHNANVERILLQTWKVAAQQCKSCGWEESFTRLSME
ncbi:hypothetical protein AVEN_267305-1 [Araneus ventricosus]|uniref:Uncharacterized protein n=1 Tax=Araneus ventricosus TaxID=182803 RepID=A0A4Y2DL36_ARAVE|nr:hypothetical protein AVEN_267305-1 [Araneus ventricosus]